MVDFTDCHLGHQPSDATGFQPKTLQKMFIRMEDTNWKMMDIPASTSMGDLIVFQFVVDQEVGASCQWGLAPSFHFHLATVPGGSSLSG